MPGRTTKFRALEATEQLTASGAVTLESVKLVASATFTPAAGGANVSEVTIQLKDGDGTNIATARNLEIWLSDAATGLGITGTTASGTVQAKAASGTVLTAVTAKKHILAQTLANGSFVLEITDTAKTGFYVAVRNPTTGGIHVSAQLVTGNYG